MRSTFSDRDKSGIKKYKTFFLNAILATLNSHSQSFCKKIKTMNNEQLISVKRSYFNILAVFKDQEKIDSRFLLCLLKWGFQLRLNPEDLKLANIDVTNLKFAEPGDKVAKLESIYHLVYMIYLDEVVEDVELEVATIYAEKVGFKSSTVSELFKSIATAAYDQSKPRNVHQEVMDFLKIHEA